MRWALICMMALLLCCCANQVSREYGVVITKKATFVISGSTLTEYSFDIKYRDMMGTSYETFVFYAADSAYKVGDTLFRIKP